MTDGGGEGPTQLGWMEARRNFPGVPPFPLCSLGSGGDWDIIGRASPKALRWILMKCSTKLPPGLINLPGDCLLFCPPQRSKRFLPLPPERHPETSLSVKGSLVFQKHGTGPSRTRAAFWGKLHPFFLSLKCIYCFILKLSVAVHLFPYLTIATINRDRVIVLK